MLFSDSPEFNKHVYNYEKFQPHWSKTVCI